MYNLGSDNPRFDPLYDRWRNLPEFEKTLVFAQLMGNISVLCEEKTIETSGLLDRIDCAITDCEKYLQKKELAKTH